jgi:hypothetical protein
MHSTLNRHQVYARILGFSKTLAGLHLKNLRPATSLTLTSRQLVVLFHTLCFFVGLRTTS